MNLKEVVGQGKLDIILIGNNASKEVKLRHLGCDGVFMLHTRLCDLSVIIMYKISVFQ